jgi:hypothetical protein
MAIKDRNGFWGSIPADSVDRKLKEEYLKSKRFTSLNSLLTKKELREIAIEEFLAQGNTYFLLMRDVFNDKFNLDSSIIPCSYSVVRSFLKFIGIYPKRQSGSKGRTRYPDEDRRAVIRDLRKIKKEKGFITDEDVEKVCKGYAMKPSKHLIKVLKKKAISEKNLLIKLSS